MNILYVIPARGGSIGVPGKNIRPLAGKPLIYYTIEAAKAVASLENICVSTDSDEIKQVVESYGIKVPFKRPDELSTNYATSEEVIIHALNFFLRKGVHYDFVVMLQLTSPLRNGNHIREALNLIDENTEMIVSVKETSSNPYYVLVEEDKNGFLKLSKDSSFTRRQDCPIVYELNGAIYIMKVSELLNKGMKRLKRRKYLMDAIYSIDIDTYLDFDIAELILNKYIK